VQYDTKINETQKTAGMKRGDVFFANLNGSVGAEQEKIRPVVIVSNNSGNENGTIVTVVPLTTQVKNGLPVHVSVKFPNGKHCIALCEQIRAISKDRIVNYNCTLGIADMAEIDKR